MFAVVGLGNPGKRYEGTRHNIGFDVVGELARRWGSRDTWQTKGSCQYQKVAIRTTNVLLVLPQEFMNLSGQAASPLLRFFKVPSERLIVVYDELDLEPGMIRIRQGGSAAGHKGVTDMLRHVEDPQCYRIRVGIGQPRSLQKKAEGEQESEKGVKNQGLKAKRPIDVSSWVLGHPRPEEKELLGHAVCDSADAVEMLLGSELKVVQGKFHRRQSSA